MFGEFTVSAYAHDAVWYDMIDRGYVEVPSEFVDKEIEIQEDIPQ
jgi:hypothetical protein